MHFYKNLTIRGKIVSIVLSIILLEIVIALSGIYYLGALNRRLSGIVEGEAYKIKLAGQINIHLLQIHRAQKNLLLSFTLDEADLHVGHAAGYEARLEEPLARLRGLADEEEREPIGRFKVSLQEFSRVNREIESLTLDHLKTAPLGGPGAFITPTGFLNARAIELSSGRARIAYDQASDVLDTIIEKMDAGLEASRVMGQRYFQMAFLTMFGLSALSIIAGLALGIYLARSIASNLNTLVSVTDSIANGKLDTPIEVSARDETGSLATSIRLMQRALLGAGEEAAARDWLKTGAASIDGAMRGRIDMSDLCRQALSEMACYAGADVGAMFLLNGAGREPILELAAGYAYTGSDGFPKRFRAGEGLIGQAALEKRQIISEGVPSDYFKVCSGLGDCPPACVTVTPFFFEDRVEGVVELGFLRPPGNLQIDYINQIMPAVAVNIEAIRGREELAKALERSQTLTEELQQQQEELKSANEELEEQTERLTISEERLKAQQEGLETANQELEQKNEYLEAQKDTIEQANRGLERARREIEEKAEQLAIVSKYKSEFLANMSHELRTPLNSMLLLARLFSENSDGSLTEDQVRSAEIILSSGNDLLSLINEILDLSRIEAGRMEIRVEQIPVREVSESLRESFRLLAEEKGLYLTVDVDEGCPGAIWTDRKRLDQILRNLVSNAVKFTDKGGVAVHFGAAAEGAPLAGEPDKAGTVSVSIRDTGPGISRDNQKIVFEAFQQLEGGTSRKHGGAGLGLSISRELARLLGGEIRLISEEGKGTTFFLYLPVRARSTEPDASKEDSGEVPSKFPLKPDTELEGGLPSPAPAARHLPDDRETILADDRSILVIEDDKNFTEVLFRQCRGRGLKCLSAFTGEEGLALARRYAPKGIILDINLPGKDGWAVLEELKDDSRTRHIPVHIVSVENTTIHALSKGAVGFLTKPVKREELEEALRKLEYMFSRQFKNLLVVEDDECLRKSIVNLIGDRDVHTDEAADAGEAIRAIRSKRYDCMILDLGLPDMNGLDLLKMLQSEETASVPPVVVYTGRQLTQAQEEELQAFSESIIIKGVKSEERLLDEASLFLHRVVDRMPANKRQIITNLHDSDMVFRDKQVLLVDDDMRNAFALSRVLAERGVKTLKAPDGMKALELLDVHPGIDLVLMDIMMPVMDGYETIRRIRAQDRFQNLPVIALTAKAMKQDRERCIAAGASDYLSKPVDVKRLLSMMRVWMYR